MDKTCVSEVRPNAVETGPKVSLGVNGNSPLLGEGGSAFRADPTPRVKHAGGQHYKHIQECTNGLDGEGTREEHKIGWEKKGG